MHHVYYTIYINIVAGGTCILITCTTTPHSSGIYYFAFHAFPSMSVNPDTHNLSMLTGYVEVKVKIPA